MKKYYKFLLMAWFSLFLLGACSSGGDDIPDPTPEPTPEADKVTLTTNSFSAKADGEAITVKFTANKAWTASSDQTWCTVDKASGAAGTISITATVAANTTEQERTAKITIKAGSATTTATIKQAKKEGSSDNDNESDDNEGSKEGTNGGSINDMENKKW